MKIARIILFAWMGLMVLLGGLHGLVLCVAGDSHVCLKFEEINSEPCSHNHDSHKDGHEHNEASDLSISLDKCCYSCVDIPLGSGSIPECFTSKPKVKSVSSLRLEANIVRDISSVISFFPLPRSMDNGRSVLGQCVQSTVLLI